MSDRRHLAPEELRLFCEKVERLRMEGLSFAVISQRLGVFRTTIYQRLQRFRGVLKGGRRP